MGNNEIVILILRMLGSLALLIFGMKQMSEMLQKMAGPQLRNVLGKMTTNRFTGVLTGVTVTAAVQSSTATTVMTVSFVNAELLTLAQAISVIMGANIGTTLTAWIMSAGFSFNITDLVWPAFLIALLLIYRKKQKNVGGFLFGLAFMFLGLGTLRQTGIDMNLGEQEAVLNFFQSFNPDSFLTTIVFLLIGGVLTMCVQSSAAVMAITMILCSSGALPIYQGIALVMGENIGTTVTSNLAALTASTQARRAALAHMLFNLFGVVWILAVLHPFVDGVCSLVGYDSSMTRTSVPQDVFFANAAKLSVVLATFHTCFNLMNTFILIWFVPQIEKLVCRLIKPKPVEEGGEDAEKTVRLRYINAGLVQTPEIAILQAQREVAHFGGQIKALFNEVRQLFDITEKEEFDKLFQSIEDGEDVSDRTELEIARFLERVSDAHLSDESKAKIRMMLRQIGEIESIGDACFNLARTMNRQKPSNVSLTEQQKEAVRRMMRLTVKALDQMIVVLKDSEEEMGISIKESFRIENDINSLRDKLRAENALKVNEHEYNYAVGTAFTDLICECEKLGDYVVNVVEARYGK
ncbi:MAG: Na/Pi cotransporter family protein [Muribaculaceae bacterium]|nr:Na/Pi cotransporter family protein [Muribaculaceae bacterium]